MEKVEFFALTRPVQERFVESSRGASAPAPIAVAPAPLNLAAVLWAGGGAAALLGCALLMKVGYGDFNSSVAIAKVRDLGVYALLLTVSAVCALRAAKLLHKPLSLPYRTGIYLFPIGVVDARGPTLNVHKFDLDTSISVDAQKPLLRIVFPNGTRFDFPAADRAMAESARSSITEAQERISASEIPHKQRDLALLDPLFDNGFKNPFGPAEPMSEAKPGWAKYYLLIAVLAGVSAGAVAWKVRNTFSERRMYAVARSLDTAEAYQKFLARGGHDQQIVDVLLPRAELREAQNLQSVASVEQYINRHPDSKIANEVQIVLQQALDRELAMAREKASLTALREFEQRYAKYTFMKPRIDQAVNALVKTTLSKYNKQFSSGQERAAQLFEKLLAYTVKNGPTVEIRFRRRASDSIERTEKVLQKSTYFGGEKSLPGQFFDANHFAQHEAEAATMISERLAQVFPKDMLDAKLGPVLEDEAELPDVKVPTLLITHRIDMSGTFLSKKPRIIFAGVGLLFKAAFITPGDRDPASFKQVFWRAPDVKKVEAENLTAEAGYEEMSRDLFQKFSKRYLSTLFKE